MLIFRKRLSIAFISLATIGLELALIRILSLRFWYYFASMVIGVALLGSGSSGVMIILLQKKILKYQRLWLCFLAFSFSLSIPVSIWAAQRISLDVYYLAWNLFKGWLRILAIEFIMLVPFLFSGGFVCLAFIDQLDFINGHYAANLIGCGTGAIVTILLMFLFPTNVILIIMTFIGLLAGALILPWRQSSKIIPVFIIIFFIFLALIFLIPPRTILSQYKKLVLETLKPGTKIISNTEGPLGRIDVVKGISIHDAPPGMSLQNPYIIPPRILAIVDGDQTNVIYKVKNIQEWAFLDFTTDAIAYHLIKEPDVLIIGAGGGSLIGLAKYHKSKRIIGLEINPQLIKMMKGPLSELGGNIYNSKGVCILNEDARGFLASKIRKFDIIHMPLLDSPGASSSGLLAARESYLYTVESFKEMIDHLSGRGILCITLYAKNPPKDGLRLFNLAVQALREKGFNPKHNLAMIRSWESITLILGIRSWTVEQLSLIRSFSREREFDLCYLPDLEQGETNIFHILEEPHYFKATLSLLGESRQAFLNNYLFAIDAPTDDKPFFFNFLKWSKLPELKQYLKGTMPAFLELGSLLLIIALLQVLILTIIMLLFPLIPWIGSLKKCKNKGIILLYFLLIGMGFMLLEIGLLQKMILYLSHPIYSVSLTIAAFLIFGGIGSQLSEKWSNIPNPKALTYGVISSSCLIVILSVCYIYLIDKWLYLTQSWPLYLRFLIASCTIAPLAIAMGHLFPIGLREVGRAGDQLIPWAWAINGFASVIATISTPLLAMHFGFSRIIIIAAACYTLSGIFFLRLTVSNI